MKYYSLLIFLLGSLSSFSQVLNTDQSSTYAVVVGISDYQDEQIPDLRFADKDALAFAGFLQSPAGGSLDEDHLKVLINEQATVARFAIALDWLWEVVKENDKVIIYFSGHGDVERKSLTQPGFLLCWDAPSKVYMAGGAFALPMLQEVISTLSIQNKAKVIVITDACRSGKLSGSAVGGSQLTSSNLAKQYANEIKILSCQPDEYSIEGEQWGGGRGAFSYHLLEGLYGMADKDNDQTVSVREIDRYLEDHVTPEVAPQNQLPMTVGNGREKLTDVFPEILAQLKEGKKGQMQLFTATESRGIEDDVLAAADTNIVEMYLAFKQSLKDKQFLFAETGRAENDYADFYYKKLSEEPSLKRLHSSMRRNYAAALQDDAQQVMNGWMKTSLEQTMEAETEDKKARLPIKVFTEKVRSFPFLLERAGELLGKEHYMYATLQARKHFFEGYLLANSDRNPNQKLGEEALTAFRRALEWHPELPHAYWQMINVYGFNFQQPDSAEVYAKKAIELYPSWVKPYTDLAFLFSYKYKKFDRAWPYLEEVLHIDSSSKIVLNAIGVYHLLQNEYIEAEKYIKKAIQLDSMNAHTYINLGILYEKMQRFDEAEKYLNKAIQLDSTHAFAYNNLGVVYKKIRRYDEAEKYYKKAIQLDSMNAHFYNNLGNIYRDTRRYEDAEKYYKKAIQLDSTYMSAYNGLGIVYGISGRYSEAEKYFKKAIQLDSISANPYKNLGRVYKLTNRYSEAEEYLKKAIQTDSTDVFAYNDLGKILLNSKRIIEAEKYFKKAIQLDSTYLPPYNNLNQIFEKTHRYDEAEKYYKKAIQIDSTYLPPYIKLSQIFEKTQRFVEAENYLKKVIEINPNKPWPRFKIGRLYLKLGRINEAKKGAKKALELGPDSSEPYLLFAQIALLENRSEAAWEYLERLPKNGLTTWDYNYLQDEPEFEVIRKDPKWNELMQKYFPEQNKDKN